VTSPDVSPLERSTYVPRQVADGAGRYRACVLPGEVSARASARGFRSSPTPEQGTLAPGEVLTLDFGLLEAAAFWGRVVDEAGMGVAEAYVRLSRREGGHGQVSGSAETAADGSFRVEGLVPGTYSLSVLKPFEYHMVEDQVMEVPREDVRLVLERVARRKGRVSGVVVDASGRPVSGAAVGARVRSGHGFRQQFSRTDSEGRFQLDEELPAGELTLRASHEGSGGEGNAHAEVALGEGTGEDSSVRLVLPEGRELSGHVVDAQGRPVSGVSVRAWRIVPGRDPERASWPGEDVDGVKTDAAGAFLLRHVQPGDFVVEAEDWEWRRALRKARVKARAGDRAVQLVMASHPVVRGRVVGPQGQPVTSFEVNGREFRDASGEFTYRVSTPGPLRLAFFTEGLALQVREVLAPVAGEVVLPEVVLPEGRLVRGRVVEGRTSQPLEGVLVGPLEAITDEGHWGEEPPWGTRSRAEGRFRLPNVEVPQVLFAFKPGYRMAFLIVSGEAPELLFQLEPKEAGAPR